MKSIELFPLVALLALVPGMGNCEENVIIFKDLRYPIEAAVASGAAQGETLYETSFSERPSTNYDTVLIQGEMPDPNIRLQVHLKNGASVKVYDKTVIHRFPSGRFWVKYKLGSLTGEPLKIKLINGGVAADHTFTIYEAEAFSTDRMAETLAAGATGVYQPDPGFYLPAEMPFPVVRRETWKAAPPTAPYTRHAPKMFTLHHTAGHFPLNYEEGLAEMQFIQDFHQNGRGWIDIAYHFLIDSRGDMFEGRPINVVGAHARNRNTDNVGISIMGNYHPPVNQRPTPEIVSSIAEIGKYLSRAYEIDVSSFYAHRDIGRTDCPGDGLYALMPRLKDLIYNAAPGPLPGPVGKAVEPFPGGYPAAGVSVPLDQLLGYSAGR